jgi:hypothetical protein
MKLFYPKVAVAVIALVLINRLLNIVPSIFVLIIGLFFAVIGISFASYFNSHNPSETTSFVGVWSLIVGLIILIIEILAPYVASVF